MGKIFHFFSSLIGKIVLVCLICLGLYSILGFFLVPYIAKQQAQKNIEARFGVRPDIREITFNPFTFEMTVSGFNLPADKKSGSSKSRLAFERFYVNLSIFPLLKKEIHLVDVNLKSAHGQFIVYKDGSINWEMKEDKTKPEKEEPSADWILTLEHIQIDNSGLDFLDYTHVSPMEIPMGPVNLRASNLSTSLGSKTSINSLALAVGEAGHIKLSGSLHLKPVSADINLDVAELPLDFLTAYLSDKTLLSLKKGNLDVLGNVKYEKGNVLFSGDSEVHDIVLIQEGIEDPVIAWGKMKLKDIKVQTVPMSVRVVEVALDQLRTEIILRKDGTLNFRDFIRNAPNTKSENTKPEKSKPVSSVTAPSAPVVGSAAENSKKSSSFDFLISKLTLSNGSLDYADQQIKPHFAAHVHGLEGTISPISPNVNQKINVDLSGLVEAYGKFKGKGYVIPGEKRPSLNLAVNFHNIEMTTFTPYSGHFAGYEISKGKLFLDLNYTLVNNRIKGSNQVLLDQFTLGNKVESEKAPGWPLKLALALMKDRKGQIKFKLPVEGDINSPEFSWGNLIWTAIKNMVINIVAAPFDFLASLIGGGDNLQSVLFEPGTATLKPDESVKIEKLGKALDERPNLAMEITGQYQDQDVAVLQHNNINKKLEPLLKKYKGDRAEAVRALAKTFFKGKEMDSVVSSYESAHGKNAVGLADEIENKLASTVVISDDELKALGLARGNVVMAALVANKVSAERLYLLAGAKADKDKPPQALLSLKDQ